MRSEAEADWYTSVHRRKTHAYHRQYTATGVSAGMNAKGGRSRAYSARGSHEARPGPRISRSVRSVPSTACTMPTCWIIKVRVHIGFQRYPIVLLYIFQLSESEALTVRYCRYSISYSQRCSRSRTLTNRYANDMPQAGNSELLFNLT
jgi:hypothetical protein